MINRPRTAFVSVAAVAVSMILLGSDARAKSVPAASPKNFTWFLRRLPDSDARAKSVPAASPKNFTWFLRRLPDARTGMSLIQRLMTLEMTRNILKHIPLPNPSQVQRIATLYNREMSVFSKLQTNISALVADGLKLKNQYDALEAQKEALISQGRILAAHWVGMKAGKVANELYGLPVLISTERGIATPVR